MTDKINEIKIKTLDDFHKAFKGYNYNFTFFRGVKKASYELKPRVGRLKFKYPANWSLEKIEKDLLRLFEERAIPYLDRITYKKWEWLAIAQHYRLPTRLLDWTRNPLVAAYFAVEKKYDGNSAIYALPYSYYIDVEEHNDPFKYDKFCKFIPPHITNRISAQSSVFTFHPKPDEAFKGNNNIKIDKIIIENKNDFRLKLKNMLYHYGVHEASLFPGLDSLSHHIEWMKRYVHDIDRY